MSKVKELILREFGDHGADTLDRYFTQLEYTAYWCIRMLRPSEEIEEVIPEAVEDLVIRRVKKTELHQVKTRDESRGPWTLAEVFPILCQQYHRRTAFAPPHSFFFVSNRMSDNLTRRSKEPGTLYRLKLLLELFHANQQSALDVPEFDRFRENLVPRIQSYIKTKYKKDIAKGRAKEIEEQDAVECLRGTRIDTDSVILQNTTANNISELGAALELHNPGGPSYSFTQLEDIYGRLLLLIAGKIRKGTSIVDRAISPEDVLECRESTSTSAGDGFPDLLLVQGRTVLEKKIKLGGFDTTEVSTIYRQKARAQRFIREVATLRSTEDLQGLTESLLDLHFQCRDTVCRRHGIAQSPGPAILAELRPMLASLPQRYFSERDDIDDKLCLGLLWVETERCAAWWHQFGSPSHHGIP